MNNASEKECPYCGSTDVIKTKLSKKGFAISILLLGAPLPFLSKQYHCFDCGKDFRASSKSVQD